LQASFGPLEGGPITVIGRLAPGVTRAQADAELRAAGQRASDRLPATHKNLRPRVTSVGLVPGVTDLTQLAITNLPALLVMLIACINVGTLVYARTATREGEIALRSALGASRSRIVGQLFIEALVLSLLAAAVGLTAADRVLRWGIAQVTEPSGGPPFWVSPGLSPTTIIYAAGLALLAAALLSVMPALKVTRARVQSHLINLGSGGSTLRFGRVWTTAMIVQVAITVIAIPVAGQSMNEMLRKVRIRAAFPSQEYLAARVELDAPFAGASTPSFAAHRAQVFGELEERLRREPGVTALAHADLAPGGGVMARVADIEAAPGAATFDDLVWTSAVGPDFFETFASAIIAGRDFDGRDRIETAHSVIVNQAFAARFSRTTGRLSPIGARLRYTSAGTASTDPWFEVVGVARNIGLDPEDRGLCCEEAPYVYHAASPATMTPFIVNVRMRGNPAPLAARLPALAAAVDAGLRVEEARTLEDWIGRRNAGTLLPLEALSGVTLLALFLSALGVFSLMSVSVSRRTREIGLRSALGASPWDVIGGIVARAARLMGGGVAAGGGVLLLAVTLNEDDRVPLFVGWLATTSGMMFIAGVFACLGPTRRALRINPTDALRET
jgi:predicted permease